jgi:hypothetical protein
LDVSQFIATSIDIVISSNQCSDHEDKQCINSKVRSTTNFTGVMGKITIGPDGKAQRPLVVNAIKDNKMNLL